MVSSAPAQPTTIHFLGTKEEQVLYYQECTIPVDSIFWCSFTRLHCGNNIVWLPADKLLESRQLVTHQLLHLLHGSPYLPYNTYDYFYLQLSPLWLGRNQSLTPSIMTQ